jgi:hypothetical protein
MRWLDFPCASGRIFQRVETLISLAKFLASMYFHEVVHFSVHGAEIFPGNLGGNVKFLPPRKFHSLTPKILPQGQNFRPQRLVYKRRGRGEDTLWHLLPPRPSLCKPPPPSHQALLRRLPSRRNLRISPARALLDVGSLFLCIVFTMDDGIVPNLSP